MEYFSFEVIQYQFDIVWLPQPLRGLVQHILKMSEQRVDFVLDTYNSSCLKDITIDTQGDELDDSDKVHSFGSG